MKRNLRIVGIAGTALLMLVGLLPAAAQAAPASKHHRSPSSRHSGHHAHFVEAYAFSPGTKASTYTVQLSGASSSTGDLYVAWVCEYDAAGQVHVSDDVNGAWTRGPSERFSNGAGDIALYYVRPIRAPRGATVTISASAPTYISGSVAHYRGLRRASLVTSSVAEQPLSANDPNADSGMTGSVRHGDLLFGALIAGGLPNPVGLGSSQGRPLVQRAIDDSGSALAADVLSTKAGQQHAAFTLAVMSDWYVVAAVFRPDF